MNPAAYSQQISNITPCKWDFQPFISACSRSITGFADSEVAAKLESYIGDGEGILPQTAVIEVNSTETRINGNLQRPISYSGPIIQQQMSGYSSYNPGNNYTEDSNLIDLALEMFQNEPGHLNDSNLSYATPETSRSPHEYIGHPEITGFHYLHEVLTRRRHSSNFSINSGCETPCETRSDSEASYHGSENFDVDNGERSLISFQDSTHLSNSDIPQSVPEMLGVQNSQVYSNNSEPTQDYTRDSGPPPPYDFPHITEPIRVAKTPPPSYTSCCKPNKVQRRSSYSPRNIVQDFNNLPQETDTEALLRLFGQGQTKSTTSVGSGNVHLWQFLIQLLADSRNSSIICWEGSNGEFKLVQPEVVAAKWGDVKNKANMSYDKLSRSLRYYYDRNMMAKNRSKKFVYQFLKEGILAELRTPKVPDSEFIQQHCKRV